MICVDVVGELWFDVVSFEGLYKVSNKQRVKSIGRFTEAGVRIPERILRPGKHKDGYLKLTLCKGGKLTYLTLHRIIATALIPNPKNLPCINHIDGNPANNSIDNLEWCTYSHNTQHAYRMGRLDRSGALNSMSKLSKQKVIQIYKSKDKSKNIAAKHKISRQLVNDIKAGRRWVKVTALVN